MDLRNSMSLAAIVMGTIHLKIRPEWIFNLYMTSVLLEKGNVTVYTKAETAKMLKEFGRCVSRVETDRQRRTLHILSTISAAGRLTSAVVVIFDSKFPEPQLLPVRRKRQEITHISCRSQKTCGCGWGQRTALARNT